MITAEKVLTEKQLNRLLKRLETEKVKSLQIVANSRLKNPGELRIVMDYYLFSVIANTGMRISEALGLKPEWVHEDYLVIPSHLSKNKKAGSVYFGLKTKALFDELSQLKKQLFEDDDCPYVFSFKLKPMSRSLAHGRFKYWLQQTKLPQHFSIHSLRHTYGTLCLDKGLPLTFVRDNLRHSNISITSQYLHLTKANRERVKDLF